MADNGDQVISKLRAARQLRELRIKKKAAEVYETFTKSERTVVQFGMFPAEKMRKAEKELADEFAGSDFQPFDAADIGRLFTVGIMDAANAGKQKIVV